MRALPPSSALERQPAFATGRIQATIESDANRRPAAPAPPPLPSASNPDRHRSEFLRGLTSRSTGALVGALLVAALWTAGLIALITPEWVASESGYRLVSGTHDRQFRVTSLALELGAADALPPGVFLFGASDFREALVSPKALSGALDGTPVHDLYSFYQSLLDSAALVEPLPDCPGGVAVVLVGPKRLAQGVTYTSDYNQQPPFYRNLGFRSETREAIAARESVATSFRSRSLLLDNYQFYLPRIPNLLSSWFGPPPRVAVHAWTQGLPPMKTLELVPQNHAELRSVLADYAENLEDSLDMLAHTQALLTERGLTMVLVEAPFSTAAWDDLVGPELAARYAADIAAFATERNLAYWDPWPELQLPDDAFWDAQHIGSPEARQRFTQALAQRLHPLLASAPSAGLARDRETTE